METLTVRLATLDDVPAITKIHCSTVSAWRHPESRAVVAYEDLDLYGRWRNGGPWMSVELCAVHLDALLSAHHQPLVAVAGGKVVGEAEYILSAEAGAFSSLHLSVLYVDVAWQGRGVGSALVAAGIAQAHRLGLPAVTTQPEAGAESFYTRLGFAPWRMAKEMQLRAEGAFPADAARVLEAKDAPPPTLALRIGRYQCGAQGWQTLWPSLELPGWSTLRRWAWRVNLDGGMAILGLREQLTDPSQVDGYAWLLPEAPLEPALGALRGAAATLGFSAVDVLLESGAVARLRERFRLEFQNRIVLWRKDL
ncbi:MAG: GNAT family N-acetyltransferase [Anaerolineae bacterium]|nr:GNAT family N-acetyltransferase [Anaerolineae bacterium]